jgi:hypothetical protein
VGLKGFRGHSLTFCLEHEDFTGSPVEWIVGESKTGKLGTLSTKDGEWLKEDMPMPTVGLQPDALRSIISALGY